MRAVLDVNVLISALLAPEGSSAALLVRWLQGDFELVIGDELLLELAGALTYPKLRARVAPDEADAFLGLLRRSARFVNPTASPQERSRDPKDDYLVALAAATDSFLVSWDRDLLELGSPSIEAPPVFLARLAARG